MSSATRGIAATATLRKAFSSAVDVITVDVLLYCKVAVPCDGSWHCRCWHYLTSRDRLRGTGGHNQNQAAPLLIRHAPLPLHEAAPTLAAVAPPSPAS